MMIRNSLFAAVALLMTGCGIYKPYTRPEVTTDGIYREPVTPTDTASLADLDWRALFPDERLQQLIDTVLVRNTDLRTAQLQVEEAEATLRTARLSLLPSFTLAPQGGVSSFDNSKGTWTYNLPVTASWEIDIFSRLRNGKLRNKALYYQSIEYRQAVRTQLIATTANLYFTLCMLDEQYAIANETASAWREAVDAIRAMKDAGMATEAAVAQNEAAYYSVETSVKQLAQSISETENSLCSLLAQTPHKIERGSLESQQMPADLLIGVPVQLLSRRPDVRRAEYSLMSAYYATAEARSALYPQITLSGTAGWTNSAGSQIVNPGKLLLSAAGQLLQPIFQAGANRARVKIAKAQQQEAMLAYEQTILNAGQEVNDALTACQTARESAALYDQQGRIAPSCRREHRAADAARLDDLPRSADRTAVAPLGAVAAGRQPFHRIAERGHALPRPRRRTRNGSGAVAFFLRPIFTTGKSEQGFPGFFVSCIGGNDKIFRFSHRPLDYHLQFRIFVRSVTKTKERKSEKQRKHNSNS